MRDRLIDTLVRGDRSAWAAIGALWLLATLAVLFHRPAGPHAPGTPRLVDHRAAWTWLLLVVATGTSLAALPLSAAIAMPRVRWSVADAPSLLAANPETWRKLRGPVVPVAGPDIAVPTVDASDRWVLYGLLSGKPAPGLPAAEPAPSQPGAPRLCRIEGDACRPWPVAWPDPARPLPQAELTWSPADGHAPGGGPLGRAEDALAFDVESGLYLHRIDPAPGPPSPHASPLDGPHLEIVGRISADEPREGSSVLFVVREVVGGRLQAMRVVATPAPGGAGHVFRVQRAAVSLTAGPRTFAYGVRPALFLTSLSLPLGVIVFLLAPLIRRRRGETRREAARWIGPYLEGAAVLAAGIATAGPAVVAMASLWGSR